MKFEISKDRSEYIRVRHDNQNKVCTSCLSDQHLYADCPRNKCYRCNEHGHLARFCPAEPCEHCSFFPSKCKCAKGDDGQVQRPSEENVRKNHVNDTEVDKEFARMNRERKRKQDDHPTEVKISAEVHSREPDVKVQKINKVANTDKNNDNNEVSMCVVDDTANDEQILNKQNSNDTKSDDKMLNMSLREGPFSLEGKPSESESDAGVKWLGDDYTPDSMEDDDGQNDPDSKNDEQLWQAVQSIRRNRLVTRPYKSAEELQKLRHKNNPKN